MSLWDYIGEKQLKQMAEMLRSSIASDAGQAKKTDQAQSPTATVLLSVRKVD